MPASVGGLRAGGALDPAGDYNIAGQWTFSIPPAAAFALQTGTTLFPNQHQGGFYMLSAATAMTVTLPAPTAGVDDGIVITFSSDSAVAHVINITNFDTGSDATASFTFNPYKGATLSVAAYNGRWKLLYGNGGSVG